MIAPVNRIMDQSRLSGIRSFLNQQRQSSTLASNLSKTPPSYIQPGWSANPNIPNDGRLLNPGYSPPAPSPLPTTPMPSPSPTVSPTLTPPPAAGGELGLSGGRLPHPSSVPGTGSQSGDFPSFHGGSNSIPGEHWLGGGFQYVDPNTGRPVYDPSGYGRFNDPGYAAGASGPGYGTNPSQMSDLMQMWDQSRLQPVNYRGNDRETLPTFYNTFGEHRSINPETAAYDVIKTPGTPDELRGRTSAAQELYRRAVAANPTGPGGFTVPYVQRLNSWISAHKGG